MNNFKWISNELQESFEQVSTRIEWSDTDEMETVYVEPQISLKLQDDLVATVYEDGIMVEKIDSTGLILEEVLRIHGVQFNQDKFDLWLLESMSAADLIFAIARASGYIEKPEKGAN